MTVECPSARELATRLGLRATAGRREWRGACPGCGYSTSFVLTEKQGRVLGWCASCQDNRAIGAILRGACGFSAPPLRAIPPARAKASSAEKAGFALKLWAEAVPAVGTPAQTYLATRGLPDLARSPALRFHPRCPHPSRARLPAMVALVTGPDEKPVAIHRTFLRPDGTGKALMDPPKATLGPVAGAAIRLDTAGPALAIGEGIESSASAGRLLRLPAWCAISAGNLARRLILPAEIRTVTIAADADPAGERAGREAGARWLREGRQVHIAKPNAAGQDFNELLRARPS